MPTGLYIRRKAEDGFVKQYPTPISRECGEWLAYIEYETNSDIEHARNGPEYRAGKRKIAVDGYNR